MPGIAAPENYPIRDPRDPAMVVGRICNPPRYIELGGLDGQRAWAGSGGKKNEMRVERATNVRAMKDSTGMNADAT